MSKMTSRERIIAAAKRQEVDRVPVSPWGLGRLDPNGAAARELIEKTDIILRCGEVDPFLGKRAEVLTEKHGDVTTTIIRTPRGDLIHRVRRTDVTAATIEFPLKGIEDVEKLLSIPYEPPDISAEAFLRRKHEIGEEGLVVECFGNPVCIAASWFSPEDFCVQWMENR